MNVTKDKIVEQIFLKLGRKEGIKMRDVFNLFIPDLVDILKIQRCSLFSVMEDRERVILEAGYPRESTESAASFPSANRTSTKL